MKRYVLFADNDKEFLDTRSEQLEAADFIVFKAASLEEAEQILQTKWVHFAIIDLRLRDDNDDRDMSGLTLAKREEYRSIPKIMLTRFPSYEYVREALGPALMGLPPAVDFLAKQEGSGAMMQALEKAFALYVRINLKLIIRFGGHLSFSQLASLSDPAGELEDLFRSLFYDYKQITLSKLLIQREKRVALAINAFSSEGTIEDFIVVCGQRDHIQTEEIHYDNFAPKSANKGNILKTKSAKTLHFAAIAYTLAGGNVDQIATFTEFFHHNSVEMVAKALDNLFIKTLSPWHEKGRYREENKTLSQLYWEPFGLSTADFAEINFNLQLEHICREARRINLAEVEISPQWLTFHLASGVAVFYPNPVAALTKLQTLLTSPILCGITYGYLYEDSILVDPHGQTWLIDFSQTGLAPLLRDFVSLESALKFDLLTTLDFHTHYELEQRLLNITHLSQEINSAGLEPEIQKTLLAVNYVRQHIPTILTQDITSYWGGLFYDALIQLRRYNPIVWHTRRELIPFLHRLISAAMLSQKLIHSSQKNLPPQAMYSLWVDEPNKEVWVEGKRIDLTPGEYDLLMTLYGHPNQLRARQNISQELHGLDHGPETEDAINAAMTRLRKKIEPDPEHPQYIITIRGQGYKLELKSSFSVAKSDLTGFENL
ncbi:MAG: DNA-binding response regulator [Anaerolineae bacterium]